MFVRPHHNSVSRQNRLKRCRPVLRWRLSLLSPAAAATAEEAGSHLPRRSHQGGDWDLIDSQAAHPIPVATANLFDVPQPKEQAQSVADGAPVKEKLRTVYVIDDEALVREVIQMQLLAASYQVRVFANGDDFLRDLDDCSPGVVISDKRMPGISGVEIQRHLRQQGGRFRMILLSGYPETRVAVEAMKQGAVMVLDKPYNKEHLLSSLNDAFSDLDRAKSEETGLPPRMTDGSLYLDRLSPREREVVDLVYNGETNRSIALRLAISIKTVEKHRGKAMHKMEVASLAHLIRLMVRELAARQDS